MSLHQIYYTLQIADNALINGHRLSEWCGHGPVLEQDIALTNIALDHLGQARNCYQYAAAQINILPVQERKELFLAPALEEKTGAGIPLDEDDLAFLRDGWNFRNVLLVEQPNKDWAYTVARSFYYDAYNYYFFTDLLDSADTSFSAIAEKSLKEVSYHLRWSSEWIIRLGDGTTESRNRILTALRMYWSYTGELLTGNKTEHILYKKGIGVLPENIKDRWMQHIHRVLDEATLPFPTTPQLPAGGKEGQHSEHLGYILTELQFMQRAYPGMSW